MAGQEKAYPINDFSGGIQRKTSKFLKKANEVDLAVNIDFSRIGAVQKTKGYTQKGNDITGADFDTTTTSSSTTTSTSTSTSSTSTSTSTSSTTTMA